MRRRRREVYLSHCFLVIPAGLAFRDWHAALDSQPAWYFAVVCLSGLLGWPVARFYSEPLNRRLRQRPLCAPVVSALETRYEQVKSGAVEVVEGETFFEELRQREGEN